MTKEVIHSLYNRILSIHGSAIKGRGGKYYFRLFMDDDFIYYTCKDEKERDFYVELLENLIKE